MMKRLTTTMKRSMMAKRTLTKQYRLIVMALVIHLEFLAVNTYILLFLSAEWLSSNCFKWQKILACHYPHNLLGWSLCSTYQHQYKSTRMIVFSLRCWQCLCCLWRLADASIFPSWVKARGEHGLDIIVSSFSLPTETVAISSCNKMPTMSKWDSAHRCSSHDFCYGSIHPCCIFFILVESNAFILLMELALQSVAATAQSISSKAYHLIGCTEAGCQMLYNILHISATTTTLHAFSLCPILSIRTSFLVVALSEYHTISSDMIPAMSSYSTIVPQFTNGIIISPVAADLWYL